MTKKIIGIVLAMTMCFALTVVAFASSEPSAPSAVTTADFAPVIAAITTQLSVSTVIGVLAWILSLTVGLFFMWWAVRKGLAKVKGAFTKGKMSV